jgi:predicted DNA-binding protein YlxM (UPF0122 family)
MRKELCDRVRALVSEDEVLSKFVELLIADYKPREIAEKFNLQPDAIYNLFKRLRRLVNPAPGKEGNNGKAEQRQNQKTKQPLQWRRKRCS